MIVFPGGAQRAGVEEMKTALIEIADELLIHLLILPPDTKIIDCCRGRDGIVIKVVHDGLDDVPLDGPIPTVYPQYELVSKPVFRGWGQTYLT